MSSPVAGWYSPVALGLIEPQLLAGVPFVLAVVLALGTMLLTVAVSYAMPLVGLLLYGVARVVTRWDPEWWGVVWGHLDYRASYYEA